MDAAFCGRIREGVYFCTYLNHRDRQVDRNDKDNH